MSDRVSLWNKYLYIYKMSGRVLQFLICVATTDIDSMYCQSSWLAFWGKHVSGVVAFRMKKRRHDEATLLKFSRYVPTDPTIAEESEESEGFGKS